MKYLCANINYWNAAFWCLYYFKSWFHFILFCFVGKCILSSVQVYTYDEGIVQVEYKERIIATVVVHHHIVGPLFSPCIFARNMFHSVYWSKGEKKMNEIAIINNSCEIDKLQNNFRKVWIFLQVKFESIEILFQIEVKNHMIKCTISIFFKC